MLGVDNKMTSSSRTKWRLFSASTCKERTLHFYFYTTKSSRTIIWMKTKTPHIYRAINYSFLQILKKLLSFQAFFVLKRNTTKQQQSTKETSLSLKPWPKGLASSHKLNLRRDMDLQVSSLKHASHKSPIQEADICGISLANKRLLDVSELGLTWVGWPNDETELESTCV